MEPAAAEPAVSMQSSNAGLDATSPPKGEFMTSNEKTISEILECPICQDLFREPCETTCGHSFCEFCINKWMEKKHSCPVCNKDARPVHPSWTLRAVVLAYKKFSSHPDGEEEIVAKSSANSEEEKRVGNMFYNNGQFAEAIDHYTKAIRSLPSPDHVLYNNRAQAYIRIEQYQRALEDLEKAVQLSPTSVKALIRKAKCHEAMGDFDQAMQAMLSAKQCNADNPHFAGEISAHLQRLSAHPRPGIAPIPPHGQPAPQHGQPPQQANFYYQTSVAGGYPGAQLRTAYMPPPAPYPQASQPQLGVRPMASPQPGFPQGPAPQPQTQHRGSVSGLQPQSQQQQPRRNNDCIIS